MQHQAVSTNQDVDSSILLGYLFFPAFSECKISASDLETILLKHNIPKSYVRKISPADAFRRVTSELKGSYDNAIYNGNPHTAKIEVDEVTTDTDCIVRVVSRKIIDKKNVTLHHEQVATITYSKKTDVMGYVMNPNLHAEAPYETMLMMNEQLFKELKVYHNHDTIRNCVNLIISRMYPTNLVKNTSARFVSKTHRDMLFRLKDAMADLASFTGNHFALELIPIIDTLEQRAKIETNAKSDITDEISATIASLAEALKQGPVSPKRAQRFLQRFVEHKNKVLEYEQLLEVSFDIYVKQIEAVVKNIDDNTSET